MNGLKEDWCLDGTGRTINIEGDPVVKCNERSADYYVDDTALRNRRLHPESDRAAAAETIFWGTGVTAVIGMTAANDGKSHVSKSQKQKYRCQC